MEQFPYRDESWDGETKEGLSLQQEGGRKVLYIPIVHTIEDLGSLAELARSESVRRLGRLGWKRKIVTVDRLWTEIEETMQRLEKTIPWDSVRVYQDGLPVCGREPELVEELARKGSRNHALVLKLMRRGAIIMGTESPDLLIEEYEQAKRLVGSRSNRGESDRVKSDGSSLLQRRDQFIAGRINETLQEGEIGILFLGMLHSLDTLLDQDIKVLYPLRQSEPVKRSS